MPGERAQVLRGEFLEVLASVPVPRDPRGRRYWLTALLAIAILATAAGMRGYAGFGTWARTAPEDVLAQLGIRFRTPSEKTFRTVLSRLDAGDLDRRLGAYFTSRGPTPVSWFRSRSTASPARSAARRSNGHVGVRHRARLVLGQLAVAEKSNEIPCVRTLLKLLPRRVRWLVTVDAMHTQVATANLICTTVKSHYLMVVKANQAGLLACIAALPWANVPVVATDDGRGHGRVETRTLQILTATRGIGFPYAKQSSGSPANASSRPPANAASRSSTPFAACRSSKPGQRK